MAYVNIILLTLGIIGIVYGTVRLVMAKKYILVLVFTLFVSWWAIGILYTQLCSNLLFVGLEYDWVWDGSLNGTLRALYHHGYLDLLLLDLAGLAYPALLIFLSRRGVLAKGLKPHTEVRIEQ